MELPDRFRSRAWGARLVTALLVVALLAPAVGAALGPPSERGGNLSLRPGTIESPANGTTVIGVQGYHFQGQGSKKKPARVVLVGPEGELRWTHLGEETGSAWVYDVDPLENGNLLVTSTGREAGDPYTLVYELDPETRERVWTERFPFHDTHDVDLINDDQLLIANMRAYDEETGENDDRILVYDRPREAVVWEWQFAENGYRLADGGPFADDWTHVNDVDKIGEGQYLVSVRNFDQVIVVNRSTGGVDYQLGSDDAHDVIHEQHNPDWLVSEDGTPTILVADSENDRVVEYARRDGEWVETWELGVGQFAWPRDADRLPNGNTLVTDSLNHRVMEVTPRGKIVWEYYAIWGPYDAERTAYAGGPTTGGSRGPTIADMGLEGSYRLYNSAGIAPGTGGSLTPSQAVQVAVAGTPLAEPVGGFARTYGHVAPWVKPVWMGPWAFVFALLAALLVVGWGIAELAVHRNRVRARIARAVERI
jgi:hypothetical protein